MKEQIIKVKHIEYLQSQYLLVLHPNSLELYSSENLELLQRLWFPQTRMLNVYFLPSKQTLLLLSERHMFCYSFVFTRLATIKFFKQPGRDLPQRAARRARSKTDLRGYGR